MTSGVVSCSKSCFTRFSVQVRDQLALEPRDLVLEDQLALLEALELQLVGLEVERQARNDLVEVAMRDAQLTQLFNVLEKLAIDVVLIFDFAHRLAVRPLETMGDRLETGGKLKPAAKGIPRHGGIVEIRAHRGEQVESAAQRGDAIGVVGAHAGHAGFERRAAFLHEGRGQFAQLPRPRAR